MYDCCYFCFTDKVILIPIKLKRRNPDTHGVPEHLAYEYEDKLACLKCLKENV